MATSTFENLSSTKRDQFLDAAFREFALNDYHSASISRIVASLGIAKGSVYQYFADKADLYFYLLERASARKLEFIRERAALIPGKATFFDLLRSIVLSGAAFDFGNPPYSLLIMNAMREPPGTELGDLSADLSQKSSDFLFTFVADGLRRGEIRDDLEAELIVGVTNAITLSVGPYIERKYRFSLRAQLKDPEQPLPFSPEDLEREVDALIEVLRRGIGSSQRGRLQGGFRTRDTQRNAGSPGL